MVSKNSSRILLYRSLFVLAIAAISVVRFWGLGEKPPHHDETINGWFVTQMWQLGYFKYDPTNYHGPLLFYLFQWLEPVFGSSIEMMRGVTSFFSVLTVGLFLYLGIIKERYFFLLGAMALLLSPAAEFFAHSAIHESVFVFFIALLLFCSQIATEKTLSTAIVGLLGLLLLKETWVLLAISFVLAVFSSRIWQDKLLQQKVKNFWSSRPKRRLALNWLFGGGVVLGLFFSGFLQNPMGIFDFFKAFLPWTKTGVSGAGHEKPISAWLELLFKYELPTLALLAFSVVGLFLRSAKLRFFSFLSVIHFLLYSIIPYKTPWCLVSIQLPLVFSGVLVIEDLFKKRNIGISVATAFLGLCLWHIPQLKALNWNSPIQMDHPYVYVQTQYDIKNLVQRLSRAEVFLSSHKIQIATAEAWPFPWLLRKYPLLGYGAPAAQPDLEAVVVLFDANQADRIRPQLKETHWERALEVRQSREPAVVFIRHDLLEKIGAF